MTPNRVDWFVVFSLSIALLLSFGIWAFVLWFTGALKMLGLSQ